MLQNMRVAENSAVAFVSTRTSPRHQARGQLRRRREAGRKAARLLAIGRMERRHCLRSPWTLFREGGRLWCQVL